MALSWAASSDNVGVTGYRVFRDGAQVGTPATTSYTDTGLTAATTYRYTVAAVDAAGNVSSQSAAVVAHHGCRDAAAVHRSGVVRGGHQRERREHHHQRAEPHRGAGR